VLELRALDAHVDGLGLGGLELGLRLHHVGLGRHPAREPVLGQAEELLEGGDGLVEQLLLSVQGAQLEVVLGQLRLEAQARRLQVSRARLGGGPVRLHPAADPSPDVQFPREIEAQLEVRAGAARGP
jgi:hypothetical protein